MMKYPNELCHYGAAEEIANACGVSRQAVYYWKRKGEIPPRVEKKIRRMVKRKRALLKPAERPAPAPAPEPQPQPQPETLKLKLSDIAQMIADYLKQEGM